MIERDKQVTDQQKKHAADKKRHEHKRENDKSQTSQPEAGMSTDPKAMEDKGYQERIEKKTEKH